METLQNSGKEVKYSDITEYLNDNYIALDVDNYELTESSRSLLDSMGANHHIKGQIVSIFYKDLDRKPILDNGLPYRRIRLSDSDVAEGRPKYLSPAGSSNHLYIPASFKSVYESTTKHSIFITEGEKKADVACGSGIPCIALSGIYSWASSDESTEKHIMPELADLIKVLDVDTVVVIFDSDGDLITKDEVTAAERKLLKIEPLSSGKFVKNLQVRKAASALATTIAKDTQVKVAHGFCKHIITEKTEGNVKHLKTFVKNGLDDWLINNKKEAENFLQYLESKAELPAIAKKNVSVAIGYEHQDTDDILLIYRKDLDSINRAKSTSLRSAQALRTLIGDDIEKYRVFSEDGADKFDVTKAHADIYKACMDAGHTSTSRLNKEGGLWRTADNSIVLNTSKSLYRLEGSALYRIDRVLDTKEVFPRPRNEYMDSLSELAEYPYPSQSDVCASVTRTINNLKSFNFQTGSVYTPHMILAWIASQIYCGLVDTRPHIYISGEMGSGKSHLLRYVAHLLKGNALYVQNTSNTTLAGLNNAQANNATTCILDEVELTESDKNHGVESKISNFIELIKAAYSLNGLGFNAIKGTQDGGYRDTGARAGFLFASIVKGKIDRAAESRIITVPIDNRLDSKEVDVTTGLEDGKIIRRFMLSESVYGEFMDAQRKIYGGIRAQRKSMTERDATTLSYISAASVPLYSYFTDGTDMSKEELICIAVTNMIDIFDAASQHTDMRHEGHKSLDILRTLPIDVQYETSNSTTQKKRMRLIDVVAEAVKEDNDAINSLALHSMYIYKNAQGSCSLCLTHASDESILKKSKISMDQIKLIKEVSNNHLKSGKIFYKGTRYNVQCFIPMELLENED